MMTSDFFLGTNEPAHLKRTKVPLFVSRSRLQRRIQLPVPIGPWALDSGGFSEITRFGRWTISAEEYVAMVRRYVSEMPGLVFAAPQDWMVEPAMLKLTGLTVADHQRLTVANFLDLRQLAPDLPFIPVLQGQILDDYRRHLDAYDAAGVDLTALSRVGLGSVCRRQATSEIVIVSGLADDGLRLHGFGMKETGLRLVGDRLKYHNPKCLHKGTCSTCLVYALKWRYKVVCHLS